MGRELGGGGLRAAVEAGEPRVGRNEPQAGDAPPPDLYAPVPLDGAQHGRGLVEDDLPAQVADHDRPAADLGAADSLDEGDADVAGRQDRRRPSEGQEGNREGEAAG